MKMKKSHLLVLAVCLLISCTEREASKRVTFRKAVDSTQTKNIDSHCKVSDSLIRLTKWTTYIVRCNYALLFNPDYIKMPKITFGELPMVLDTAYCKNDTTIILFASVYKNIRTDTFIFLNGWASGLGFIKDWHIPFYLIGEHDDGTFFSKDGITVLNNRAQKAAVDYLNKHRNTADNWFINEAKSRGLIK
jgi:hypothetical protein